MTPLNATILPAPDQVVVRLTGDADLSTAPVVDAALAQAAGHGTRQVIIDVGGVRFWDSSGLRVLSAFTARLTAADRACRLVAAPSATRRLIRLAGLDGSLDLDGPVAPGRAPATCGPDGDGPGWAAWARPSSGRSSSCDTARPSGAAAVSTPA